MSAKRHPWWRRHQWSAWHQGADNYGSGMVSRWQRRTCLDPQCGFTERRNA